MRLSVLDEVIQSVQARFPETDEGLIRCAIVTRMECACILLLNLFVAYKTDPLYPVLHKYGVAYAKLRGIGRTNRDTAASPGMPSGFTPETGKAANKRRYELEAAEPERMERNRGNVAASNRSVAKRTKQSDTALRDRFTVWTTRFTTAAQPTTKSYRVVEIPYILPIMTSGPVAEHLFEVLGFKVARVTRLRIPQQFRWAVELKTAWHRAIPRDDVQATAMDARTLNKLTKLEQRYPRWVGTPLAPENVGGVFSALDELHQTEKRDDHVDAAQLFETLTVVGVTELFFKHLASEEVLYELANSGTLSPATALRDDRIQRKRKCGLGAAGLPSTAGSETRFTGETGAATVAKLHQIEADDPERKRKRMEEISKANKSEAKRKGQSNTAVRERYTFWTTCYDSPPINTAKDSTKNLRPSYILAFMASDPVAQHLSEVLGFHVPRAMRLRIPQQLAAPVKASNVWFRAQPAPGGQWTDSGTRVQVWLGDALITAFGLHDYDFRSTSPSGTAPRDTFKILVAFLSYAEPF
ncbi:uncharacterized protein LOC62_01G000766 [Vanrija pseudolonga]|uniref:Uncharacterized protein n=1 Tax=Vanrija pseudolonga TaxID=143232 RepID=A0AAF0Y2Z6_9TREE|nr:hypothetical protein LOC62_01G000766 [Vanrija pseudolonga]